MKRFIDVTSIIVIAGALVFFIFMKSTTIGTTSKMAPIDTVERYDFSKFPYQKVVTVDFDIDGDSLSRFTKREKMDQLKDWLLFTMVSMSGLSAEEINQSLFDVPVVRQGYTMPVSNCEYGDTRSAYIGNGRVLALLPHNISHENQMDFLAHISDKHVKNLGEYPDALIVFQYYIDLDDHYATILRKEDVPVQDLYTEGNGYFEKEIRTLEDLQRFMTKIQDVIYAKDSKDCLILGGRKLQAGDYARIRVEDIAAIWQSEDSIKKQEEALDKKWNDKLKPLKEKWENVTYTTSAQKAAYERQIEQEVLALRAEMEEETAMLHMVDGSGFSLDHKYDFEGLLLYFKKLEPDLLREFADGDDPMFEPDDLKKTFSHIKMGLSQNNIIPYLKFNEQVKAQIDMIESMNTILKLSLYLKNKSDSESAETQAFNQKTIPLIKRNERLIDVYNAFTDAENSLFKFQLARYDGALKGTDVGMTLFYTDLMAKLWLFDFQGTAPVDIVTDYKTSHNVKPAAIFQHELSALSSSR